MGAAGIPGQGANYLRTLANIVEIDLLRDGVRLPTQPALPKADYYAFVIRHGDRSHVELYSWDLQDRLPVIPVPLREGDADVGLDLQQAFEMTYDRRGYDYILDYTTPIKPALPIVQQQWVAKFLDAK